MRYLIGCAAALAATSVQAQSTDCMSLGGGMVHCDTTPYVQQDWGTVFQKIHDRHVQRKLGKMMSAGDCQGAYNYALQESLELAQQVKGMCPTR